MTAVSAPPSRSSPHTPSSLTARTILATSIAALVGQVGLAIPAELNGGMSSVGETG